MPVAPAQTADQQPPNAPKLPPVRCTIAPSKETVRWQGTPKTSAVEKDKSKQRIESQTPGSDSQLAIPPSTPASEQNQSARKCEALRVERQTLKNETPNAPQQIRNAEVQGSTDAWFQISTEDPESTDIQEVALTASADDGNKAGPQPLAQVLANLAKDAQRNFVDPGISSDETITYNFADSDLDPWEAFTRIAQARGYRIVYQGNIVTLARSLPDSLNQGNPNTVKAEVWLDQLAKPGAHRSGLAIQLADTNVAPKSKPRAVQSLEAGSNAKISLIDVQSEGGDNTLGLTVTPKLLPNGNIQADLGIENAVPSANGHKSAAIRRTTKFTVELTPSKQVIEVDGVLMPNGDPNTAKQSWFQRLFRKRAPENGTARMVVRLTVEPAAGSETPADSPVRIPKSDSSKTDVALAPRQNRQIPELTSIQTLKH